MLYAFFWVIPRRYEFYIPTFRNTLSHLHRQVGVKNELGLRNLGVFIREKVWLEPNTPTFLKPSHSSHLSAYEDGTECSETSVYKIQNAGELPRTKHTTGDWLQILASGVRNHVVTFVPFFVLRLQLRMFNVC